MNNRIQYIDGLKGFSTLMVLNGHFVGAFAVLQFLKPIVGINLLLDGATAVHIFIMLSGISICSSISNKSNMQRAVAGAVLKRYLRLALPVVLPTIIAYILYRLGFLYNQQVAVTTGNKWLSSLVPEHISIANFASSVVFGPIRSSLITPLWMMHYIFLGTFIIIPLCICASEISKKLYKYVFLLMIAGIMMKYNVYYFSVVLGVIFFYNLQDGYYLYRGGTFVALVVFLVALCVDAKNISLVRAIALVTLIVHSSHLQRLFCIKPFLRLNSISYQIYLVHAPIICSWSCYCYVKFGDSIRIMIINFMTTLVLTFVFAVLFKKIDGMIGKRLNEGVKRLLE